MTDISKPQKVHSMRKGGVTTFTYTCPVCGVETPPASSQRAAEARFRAHLRNEHPAPPES